MCPGLVACLNSQPLSHNLGLTKPYRPPQSVTSGTDCTTEISVSRHVPGNKGEQTLPCTSKPAHQLVPAAGLGAHRSLTTF